MANKAELQAEELKANGKGKEKIRIKTKPSPLVLFPVQYIITLPFGEKNI